MKLASIGKLQAKILRIMKLVCIFLSVSLIALAEKSSGQHVTVSANNESLLKCFRQIEKQTTYTFFYNSDLLTKGKSVTVDLHNVSVEEALAACFRNQPFTYSILGRMITIAPGADGVSPEAAEAAAADSLINVSGVVKDREGNPLQAVSVVVAGQQKATTTNADGHFLLHNVAKNAMLELSMVGYQPLSVPVNGRSSLTLVMETDIQDLGEVVLVGYGSQKRQAITGAVVQADLKTYESVPVNNIMETLKGTVAGLNIGEANTAGAVPGYGIRGTKSIAASNSPLIVLDGVIFNGSIADISPADVESVTILKDASAAAVYGSRSANGVILIESKKGSILKGKPRFELRTGYGIVNELRPLEVYDAAGYMQRLHDILSDNGTTVPVEDLPLYLQVNERENYESTPDHRPTLEDPYDLFRQTGSNLNTTFSVSQRTDKMNYYLSGSLTDQNGVIINDRFKRYSLRLNLESDITDWMTIGIKSHYSYRDYPDARIYGAGSGGSSPYLFSPYANVFNADGSYNMFPQTTTSFVNPFLVRATEAYNRTNNVNGILTGTIRVPWIKGLAYTAVYSKTVNMNENGSFYNKESYDGRGAGGKGSRAYSRGTHTLIDHIVKYNRTFAASHEIDLTLLHSEQKSVSYGESLSASNFENDQLGTNRLQAGAIQNVSTSAAQNESLGQMARLTYTYDGRYSVTGTLRHDGYSAFSANHKYGDFSSVGVNWNLSREKFVQPVSWLNRLALRASYGTNGNQSISPYSTLSVIGNSYYYFHGDASYTYTQSISRLGNDDLLWESTTGLNAGIDFEVLDGRISGSLDGYANRTNNLAFNLNLPTTSGFNTIVTNAGEIRNKGIEVNLRTVNLKHERFSWTTALAFSLNRNKVQHLLGDRDGDGKEDDIVSSGLFIGKSMGQVYTYQVIGMWQEADKDNGEIMQGFEPGTYRLLDVNGDGKISSDSDRVFLGNSNPNFRWSLTNSFSYGDFTLLIYLNSIWGGNGWFINGGNTPWSDGYANRGDINHPVYDYWTPSNPNAEFPRPSYKDRPMAKAPKYYDRSFIQLQKVALNYNAGRHVERFGVEGLHVSFSVDNLGNYAPHWIGLDAATGAGLTVSSIPSLRTATLSLNVNF